MEQYRKSIDELDEVICDALTARFLLLREIADVKKKKDLSAADEERERKILDRIRLRVKDPDAVAYMEEIYQAVFHAGRTWEERELAKC